MKHTSNRERIARAAEEARLAAAEKAARKAGQSKSGPSKRSPASVRMKIVWEVCNANGTPVKTFPYADKAAAEAATSDLTRSTGRKHSLRPTKIPME
jgi:hypothetical protein